jgi:hypothetical protein
MKHGIYVLSASGKEMEHIRAARTEAMRGKPHTRRFKNRLYVAHSNRREKACRRAAKRKSQIDLKMLHHKETKIGFIVKTQRKIENI